MPSRTSIAKVFRAQLIDERARDFNDVKIESEARINDYRAQKQRKRHRSSIIAKYTVILYSLIFSFHPTFLQLMRFLPVFCSQYFN